MSEGPMGEDGLKGEAGREMTLEEWMGQLPRAHRAHKDLRRVCAGEHEKGRAAGIEQSADIFDHLDATLSDSEVSQGLRAFAERVRSGEEPDTEYDPAQRDHGQQAKAFERAREMLDGRLRFCRPGSTKDSMLILSKELRELAKGVRRG